MTDAYLVRVKCETTTLFAYVLDIPQRFITYDNKPRLLTCDDALEIQDRLASSAPEHASAFAISVEKVDAHAR